MQILALIPARSGSCGLRHKNIRRLDGTPLLVHAVHLAQRCRRRSEVWSIVVSTDSHRYARLARGAGAETPFLRPSVLATQEARLSDVVKHALATLKGMGRVFDAVVLLSAATPLTAVVDVRRALQLFRQSRASVVSVVADPAPAAWRFRPQANGTLLATQAGPIGRRQETPVHYRLHGAVYVATPGWIEQHGQFFVSGQTRALLMPKSRSVDIEDSLDLAWAAWLWHRSGRSTI